MIVWLCLFWNWVIFSLRSTPIFADITFLELGYVLGFRPSCSVSRRALDKGYRGVKNNPPPLRSGSAKKNSGDFIFAKKNSGDFIFAKKNQNFWSISLFLLGPVLAFFPCKTAQNPIFFLGASRANFWRFYFCQKSSKFSKGGFYLGGGGNFNTPV